MTFREIIIAAIEETSEIINHTGPLHTMWHGVELRIYSDFERCEFYCGPGSKFLFKIYPEDLLDPNWSPAALAKQINDGIAK